MSNILLLEDDLSLINGLSFAFKKQGFELVVARTLKEADSLWMDGKYDLLVLDVSLPDGTGFEFCKKVRQVSKVPIIFLTAADEEMNIIMGLDIGGDDYITKPFNPLEMVSRVKAQLRRYTLYNGAETLENKEIFDSAGLIVNHQTHVCTLYEKEIALTPTEFNILWLLCKNAGKVVSTEEIFEKIWNEKYLDSNNTVMVHIRRIREKLNEPSRNPKFIKTVWGVGYKIEKK